MYQLKILSLAVLAAVQIGITEHASPFDRLLQLWRHKNLEEPAKQFCGYRCLEGLNGNFNSLKRTMDKPKSDTTTIRPIFVTTEKIQCNCVKGEDWYLGPAHMPSILPRKECPKEECCPPPMTCRTKAYYLIVLKRKEKDFAGTSKEFCQDSETTDIELEKNWELVIKKVPLDCYCKMNN